MVIPYRVEQQQHKKGITYNLTAQEKFNFNNFVNMGYLERNISGYYNTRDLNGFTISLSTFLFSEKNKDQVEQIRATQDESIQKELKSKLPCATISGIFDNPREDAHLNQHSGLICLDIDADDNPELVGHWEYVKQQIGNIQEVFYCGLSIRGNGLFVIIPIAHSSKHREHFKALQKVFLKYGIVIDSSCINVSRLRYCSHDPEPYINENAKIFTSTYTEPQRTVSTTKVCNDDNLALEICIKKCEQYQIDVTTNEADWFKVGSALANEFGEGGRTYYHRLSRIYSDYKAHETDTKFDKCLRSGKTPIGWLINHFADYGITYADEVREQRRSEHQQAEEQPTLTILEQMQASNPALTKLMQVFDAVQI